jgi:hypothetical protein
MAGFGDGRLPSSQSFASDSFAGPSPVAQAPELGRHLGRFESRKVRVVAMVRTTEVDGKKQRIGKPSDLCPDSLFSGTTADASAAMQGCPSIWKERLIALDAGTAGWKLTVSKSYLGATTVKHSVALKDASNLTVTEAPAGQNFELKSRSSVETSEGLTIPLKCHAVVSMWIGKQCLEFTCRKREVTLSVFRSLQAILDDQERLPKFVDAVKNTPLGSGDERVFVSLRPCDLVPMRSSAAAVAAAAEEEAKSLPIGSSPSSPKRANVAQPAPVPQRKSSATITFECSLSVSVKGSAPEIKLKGSTVANATASAAAGCFDTVDGSFPAGYSQPAESKAGSLSAKLIVLIHPANTDPVVLNGGQALGLWVEADRDRMLMARLTAHPKARHQDMATLGKTIGRTVAALLEWRESQDAIPEPVKGSAGAASPPASPTSNAGSAAQGQTVSGSSSPPTTTTTAVRGLTGPAPPGLTRSLQDTERFTRQQLSDNEADARRTLFECRSQVLRLGASVLRVQQVLTRGARAPGAMTASPARAAASPHTVSTRPPPPKSDYRAVASYILRGRAERHTAAGGVVMTDSLAR